MYKSNGIAIETNQRAFAASTLVMMQIKDAIREIHNDLQAVYAGEMNAP
jgi:hypothetical protein